MTGNVTRRQFLKYASALSALSLLGGRPLDSAARRASRRQPGDGRPNFLILIFDALSAANMSLYGYPRATTPHLERLAQRATVYHSHYAGGNFTSPGTASLLTGTYPWTHRALSHAGTVLQDLTHLNLFKAFAGSGYFRIAHSQNVWADLLLWQFKDDIDQHLSAGSFSLIDAQLYDILFTNDAIMGYRSLEELALHQLGMPSSLFLSILDRVRVFAREKMVQRSYGREEYPRGIQVCFKEFFLLEDAVDGITRTVVDTAQPFLGYFHLLPPHEPYSPHHEFVGLFDDGWTPTPKEPHPFTPKMSQTLLNQKRKEYDEYVAYVDAQFGHLIDDLEKQGVLENTCVIVTSDHGEIFERGTYAHDTALMYEPLIHIPLVIALPQQQKRKDVYALTSCVDLLPTLLYLIDQSIPAWCEGRVLPPFVPGEADARRAIFSLQAVSSPKVGKLQKATAVAIQESMKLIGYRGYRTTDWRFELFDLANDPEELNDLYDSSATFVKGLEKEIRAH
jgi:arylsulfatase A-like enzyme